MQNLCGKACCAGVSSKSSSQMAHPQPTQVNSLLLFHQQSVYIYQNQYCLSVPYSICWLSVFLDAACTAKCAYSTTPTQKNHCQLRL